jgi:hypothetical protein
MGLPFVIGWGREGAIGYFENPLAFKEAKLQYKYGQQNMDLYISCKVNIFIGFDYSTKVEISNIRLGMQNNAFTPEGLIMTEKSAQLLMLEKVGKVN